MEVDPRTEPPENAREQAQGAQSGFAIQSRENSFRSRRWKDFGSGHFKVQCVRQNCFNRTPEYSCSTESESEEGRHTERGPAPIVGKRTEEAKMVNIRRRTSLLPRPPKFLVNGSAS